MRYAQSHQELATQLNDLARAAEVKALEIKQDILDGLEAKHREDRASYVFECRRWGDFLTLYMQRVGEKAIVKEAQSINLGLVRQMAVHAGHVPDCNGTLNYRRGYDHGMGDQHNVVALYPTHSKRAMFKLDTPPAEQGQGMVTMIGNYYDDPYRVIHTTPNYPRAAADDRIVFAGLNGTLFAPCGHGEEVHKAIMQEIARGWSRPEVELKP